MKIDLRYELKDINGNVYTNENQVAATLKSILIGALLAVYRGEENLSGEEKFARWNLAVRINDADEAVDMTVEEVAKVKTLIGKAYNTVIVGQVWQQLEG